LAKNKKTLKAQSAIAREQGARFATDQIASGESAERVRARAQGGLGSAAQLSGQYAGAQAKDLSKYSTGLMLGSNAGANEDTLQKLSRARAGDTVVHEAKYDKQGNLKRAALTLSEQAAGGNKGAAQELARNQVYGQVSEVNALYQQAYDAAKAGDFTTADQLQAQAAQLTSQYNLNENFDASGVGGGPGLKFSTGAKFAKLFDEQGQTEQALGTPEAMLVGGVVNNARQMMDPNSAESMRFKDSLTSGAVAAVDASRDAALRELGSAERTGTRERRDMMLKSGAAGQTAKMAAIGARSAERFATSKATLEGGAAAAKAQIYSDASKTYETFKYGLAHDAQSMAQAWVSGASGMRDDFRKLQDSLVSNYVDKLFGFATTSQTNMVVQQGQKAAGDSGGVAGALSGAVAGASAGAAIGGPAAVYTGLAGAVVGGVLGYLG
jgi:hypothetical protein